MGRRRAGDNDYIRVAEIADVKNGVMQGKALASKRYDIADTRVHDAYYGYSGNLFKNP
jgi:hypothetical protein